MNILFVVPIGQDMGGIITSTEQYVAGLKEAGHMATFLCATFTKNDPYDGGPPSGKFAGDFVLGPGTGELYHVTQGWRSEPRVTLATREGTDRFLDIASAHDITIWASMYGFRNPATEGQAGWVRCITKNKSRQLFMIHDDHMPDRYPWAYALAPWGNFAGVQPCSYDSLQSVASPRHMVYTPLPPLPKVVRSVTDRKGYLSCQVWKPWKNGDKLVAAAHLMPRRSVLFAGDGIQLRYIRSKDKCPERFAGIWGTAMAAQEYAGVLSERARDVELMGRKFLVDLSVRHNSGQYNRIAQEAMAQGCVVIANPDFITGTKGIFQPGVHYLPISTENYGPKDLAKTLVNYNAISPLAYARMQTEARKVLSVFNRKVLAEQLVAAATAPREKVLVSKAHRAEFVKVFGDKP